jgi:hypothetical protein
VADDQNNANDEHAAEEHADAQPQVLLIAHARAHLVSGEAFDLLPIKHEYDVKREVNALVESWAESGFLVRGRFIYPWHQVKQIEVTSVEELPLRLARQRLDDLYAADRARMQENFWRTRRRSETSGGREGDRGKAGNSGSHS